MKGFAILDLQFAIENCKSAQRAGNLKGRNTHGNKSNPKHIFRRIRLRISAKTREIRF